MPISTARFLLRPPPKAGEGRMCGTSGIPGRCRPQPGTRVTQEHCMHWTARAPGIAVMLELHCLHRTMAAGPLLPPP
jgi:hypothetical protein